MVGLPLDCGGCHRLNTRRDIRSIYVEETKRDARGTKCRYFDQGGLLEARIGLRANVESRGEIS